MTPRSAVTVHAARGVAARRMSTIAGVCVIAVTLASCDESPSSSSSSAGATVSTEPSDTGDVGFVPPPTCDADELVAWTAAVRIDQRASKADAVLRVAHETGQECELVLGDGSEFAPSVEPNVVIEADGWAELVVGQHDDGAGRCGAARPAVPVTSVRLSVGDADLVVPTAVVSRCGAVLTELLAAEHPTEPCTGPDVSAVWRPGGFVLRNDSSRGCSIGELDRVVLTDGTSLPATSVDPGDVGTSRSTSDGVGPSVDALAGGDVVLFPTTAVPAAECTPPTSTPLSTPPSTPPSTPVSVVDAVLVLSIGVDVPVDAPASCTSVALGAARPWFGSPGGPLDDTDPDASAADLLRALDAFGDPCVTVPVAPPDLVDGDPILSPAEITDGELGRDARWGDPATNGVTQWLDVTIDDGSFRDGVALDTVTGPARRAAVMSPDDTADGPYIDIAEADGSCVRRYVLAAGTTVDDAVAAARRWVAGADDES